MIPILHIIPIADRVAHELQALQGIVEESYTDLGRTVWALELDMVA